MGGFRLLTMFFYISESTRRTLNQSADCPFTQMHAHSLRQLRKAKPSRQVCSKIHSLHQLVEEERFGMPRHPFADLVCETIDMTRTEPSPCAREPPL